MKVVSGVMKVVLAVVVLLAVVVGVPNAIELAGQRGNIVSADQAVENGPYDCILVLGAAVRPDGTPSPVLQDRIDTGIALYNAGVAPKIVMSGDDQSDTSYDEVTNMKAYAVAQGVASEDVFCDHAGLCTYDSAYRAKNVFEAKRMVVVTQRYHIYRALYDANSLGIESVGVTSNLRSYLNQPWYSTREVAARVSDFYKVATKQTATYLSEPVSLDQSGDVTTW